MKYECTTLVTKLLDLGTDYVDSNRDDYGQWVHPLYLEYLNSILNGREYLTKTEYENLKVDLGIKDIKVIQLEDVVSGEVFEEIMDNCDLTQWSVTPEDGYFIIDIGFNEDGAYCTTVKIIDG